MCAQIDNKRIIFLHLPKTAGTTIHNLLECNYSANKTFSTRFPRQKSIALFKSLPQEKRNSIELLKGHMPFGLHEAMDGASDYFTFLREPTSRVISEYHYARKSDWLPQHEAVNKLSLSEFAQSPYYMRNMQARFIAGNDDEALEIDNDSLYEKAVHNIKNHFCFVGFQEHFDESIILLRDTIHLKFAYYSSKNVGSHSDKKTEPETLEIIKKENPVDISIYNEEKRKFDKLLNDQEQYISEELSNFRTYNAKWNFPIKCYLAWRRYYVRAIWALSKTR